MMKKVLALVMVLGMAGLTSAGLQYTANDSVVAGGSEVVFVVPTMFPMTVTFAVVNEQAGTGVFDGGAFINQGMAVMGNAQVGSGLPGSWSVIDVSADLGMPALYYSWDLPAITPFPAGKLVTVDLSGKNGDSGQLSFANVNLETVFSMNYRFVPEPMTLSLLGLGALVLRRRS